MRERQLMLVATQFYCAQNTEYHALIQKLSQAKVLILAVSAMAKCRSLNHTEHELNSFRRLLDFST